MDDHFDASKPTSMAPEVRVKHQADIYTVKDEPRSLTPADLAFVCQYTGKPSEIISPHVLAIWRMTKEQVPASLLGVQRNVWHTAVLSSCHTTARSLLSFSQCLQCWVFKCIEDFYFLQPKISLHPHYAAVQAAHRKQPQATRLRHAVSWSTDCC